MRNGAGVIQDMQGCMDGVEIVYVPCAGVGMQPVLNDADASEDLNGFLHVICSGDQWSSMQLPSSRLWRLWHAGDVHNRMHAVLEMAASLLKLVLAQAAGVASKSFEICSLSFWTANSCSTMPWIILCAWLHLWSHHALLGMVSLPTAQLHLVCRSGERLFLPRWKRVGAAGGLAEMVADVGEELGISDVDILF